MFQSRSGAQPSPYSADVTLEQVGGLTVHAAIRPRAVELLALGALPESRVPWLVGLLMLTAAMIVVDGDAACGASTSCRGCARTSSPACRTSCARRCRRFCSSPKRSTSAACAPTTSARAATGVIVQEGRRLMHLVENILHFSRAERQMTRLGSGAARPESARCRRSSTTGCRSPRRRTCASRPTFAPDVHRVADRSALRQMVLNLLDNAVKYGRRRRR